MSRITLKVDTNGKLFKQLGDMLFPIKEQPKQKMKSFFDDEWDNKQSSWEFNQVEVMPTSSFIEAPCF
jgi:hypothetical protein